jgi:hypothetical protein
VSGILADNNIPNTLHISENDVRWRLHRLQRESSKSVKDIMVIVAGEYVREITCRFDMLRQTDKRKKRFDIAQNDRFNPMWPNIAASMISKQPALTTPVWSGVFA